MARRKSLGQRSNNAGLEAYSAETSGQSRQAYGSGRVQKTCSLLSLRVQFSGIQVKVNIQE